MVPLVGTADAAAPTLQARALGVAKYQIGDPYVWVQLVQCIWLFGVGVLRLQACKHRQDPVSYSAGTDDKATKIKSTNRKVGDLIFFATGWPLVYPP